MRTIEDQHLKNKRRNIILVGEKWDFVWDEDDVIEIKKMYKKGHDIYEMMEKYPKRRPIEIAMVIAQLAEQRKIKPRETGIFKDIT